MRASLPLAVGIVPFGLVVGVSAVDAGLSPTAAFGMSVVVFAGASQLAVIDLLGRDASLVVVVVTGVIVNLRMMMYSASIAPYFQRYRTRWKAVLAYFLTDQAYAVSIARFGIETRASDAGETDGGHDGQHDDGERRDYFYLGVAASLWVVWVVTTAAGIGIERGLPDAWGLDFAVPLVFLALLVPRIEDGATAATGVVAGLVALFGSGLPYELGLPLAAVVGVAVGLVAEEVRAR